MGLFGKLVKGVVNTALLPVDILQDSVTMGGAAIDEKRATLDRIKKIKKSVEDAADDAGEGDFF